MNVRMECALGDEYDGWSVDSVGGSLDAVVAGRPPKEERQVSGSRASVGLCVCGGKEIHAPPSIFGVSSNGL